MAGPTRPPIVLVHGACSQPAHFDAWRAFFADAGHEVIVPALPGHAPPDRAVLRRARFADYVGAIRTAVTGLGRPPVLVGHSVGGIIALTLAGEGLCSALVLVSSLPTGRIPAPPSAIPSYVRVGPQVMLGLPFTPRRGAARRLALNGLPETEQDRILDLYVPESGLLYRDLLFGAARVRHTAVRCPVLVLAGAEDRLIPLTTARGITRKFSGRLVAFPGLGHWLIAPSVTAEAAGAVLAFIGKAERGQRRKRRRRHRD